MAGSAGKIAFNVSAMIDGVRAVQIAADSLSGALAIALPIGAPGEALAALSAAQHSVARAQESLHRIAAEIAARAAFIAQAEASGNPVTLTVALDPNLFRIGGLTGHQAGVLSLGATIASEISTRQGDLIEKLLTAPEQAKYDKILAEYVHAAVVDGRSAAELEQLGSRLANSVAALHDSAYWASRFKVFGTVLQGGAALLTAYSAYESSTAHHEAGKFASGVLSAAVTWYPVVTVVDVATGGGVVAEADGVANIFDDVGTSIVSGDSSHLGDSTADWWAGNESGQHGWFWHNMSQTGDATSGPIGGVLDDIGGEGWPFDGDGSINWIPGV